MKYAWIFLCNIMINTFLMALSLRIGPKAFMEKGTVRLHFEAIGAITELLMATGRTTEFQGAVEAWLDMFREEPSSAQASQVHQVDALNALNVFVPFSCDTMLIDPLEAFEAFLKLPVRIPTLDAVNIY